MPVIAPADIAEYVQLPGKSTTPLAPRIIDVHTMVWNMLDCQDYFAEGGNPYSHFGTGWDGKKWCARQWQDLQFRAASDLDGNPFCISIENADKGHGFPSWSGSDVPRFVPEQAEVLAQLIAWLCVRFDIPPQLVQNSLPDQRGPGYHRHGIDPYRVANGVRYSSSYGKACPGDRRIAQMRDEIMPRVRAIIEGDDELTPEDRQWIEETIAKYTNGLKPVIVAYDDVKPGEPDHWYSMPAQTRSEVTKDEASQAVAQGNARWWDPKNPGPVRVPRATLDQVTYIPDLQPPED